MDSFYLASPTNPISSPSFIVGELSATHEGATGLDSLFPRLPESPEDGYHDPIILTGESVYGAHYGATSQWQDWAAGDLEGEMGPTDMAAIKECDWPRRVEAATESDTTGGRVCTHLSLLLVTTVDLHDIVELRWGPCSATHCRRPGERRPGCVGHVGCANTVCGTYRHTSSTARAACHGTLFLTGYIY